MNAAPAAAADLREAEAILSRIPDPEIPVVSIRELGILRDVRLKGDGVEVVITPTYSGCPAIEQISEDVRAALAAHGIRASVTSQLAPAWTTDWMSEATHEKLRAYGIAPPQAAAQGAANGSVVRFSPKRATAPSARDGDVPCPHCGSPNTTETSHFGSTACKALYRCLDCMEPFDHFKPY